MIANIANRAIYNINAKMGEGQFGWPCLLKTEIID
jgi:hypothetical protein